MDPYPIVPNARRKKDPLFTAGLASKLSLLCRMCRLLMHSSLLSRLAADQPWSRLGLIGMLAGQLGDTDLNDLRITDAKLLA